MIKTVIGALALAMPLSVAAQTWKMLAEAQRYPRNGARATSAAR